MYLSSYIIWYVRRIRRKMDRSNPMTDKKIRLVRSFFVLALCCLAATAWGNPPKPIRPASRPHAHHRSLFQPGDVLYTDSNAALLKCDAETGEGSIVSEGDLLVQPYGIAL